MCAQRVQLKTTIDGAQVPLNPYTDCVKNVRQQMPLAGSKLLGTTVLYVGPQTDKYNTGTCYTCKATESNSYYWDTVAVPFNYDSESSQTHLYTPDGACLSISNGHPGTLHLQNASGQDVLYVGEDCASVFGRGLVFENQIFSDLEIRSGFDRSSIGRLVLGEPTEQNTVEHYLQLPVQGTEQVIRKHCKVYTVDGNYAIESGLMMPFYTDNKYISVNGDDIFAEVGTSIGNGYGAKLQIYGSTYDRCTATFKVGSGNYGYFGFGIDQIGNAVITSQGLGRGIQLSDNLDEHDQETGCSKFIVRDMDMTNMLYIAGEYATDDEQMPRDYKVTAKIYNHDIAFKEDVEAVAQRVAALQGNSGGGGAVPTITINNITPNQDGVVTLYGDDIYVQSPGDGTYQDSFNWWGQSLKQCTIYQSICDLYEYSAYKISLLGGEEFATQNGVINLTISPYDVLVREQYNDWGQLEYQTTLYDALADLNYAKMGTPNYYRTSDTSYTGDSYELDTYYSEDRPGWVFVRITAGEQDGTAVAQIQGDDLCYTHFHAGQMVSFSFPVADYTEWMIFDGGDPASDATYEIFFVPTDQLPY